MNEQLEFDLVSPHLAGLTRIEIRLLEQAASDSKNGARHLNEAKLLADLRYQDTLFAPKPNRELDELKVLLGNTTWQKQRRRWQRRLKQNVTAIRKVIICLRYLHERSNL